jgi:protein-disulfide isomerase
LPLTLLVGLGLATLAPAVVYAASAPEHRPFLTRCGELKLDKPKQGELIALRGARPVRRALFFEDPLCPTCKAFHERLGAERVLDRLDAEVSLFPLDNECNWMLDTPLHPGACIVSKAVLCGGEQARTVLEWAYDNQERVAAAGKASAGALKALLAQRFGDSIVRCIDDRKTEVRLNNHLHFASDNGIPVSTPQMYLGKQRICDEDTDIGLRYTLRQLAPEVLE